MIQLLNISVKELLQNKENVHLNFIDCGVLIQPLCTLSQNSNLRVRPEIVLKLASKFFAANIKLFVILLMTNEISLYAVYMNIIILFLEFLYCVIGVWLTVKMIYNE